MVLMRYAVTSVAVVCLLTACNAISPALFGDPTAGASLPTTDFAEDVYVGTKTCQASDEKNPLADTYTERAVLIIGKDGLPFVSGDQIKVGDDIKDDFAGVPTTGEIYKVANESGALVVTGGVRLAIEDTGYYGDLYEVYTSAKDGAIDYEGQVELLIVDENGEVTTTTSVCSCLFEPQ